MVVASPEMQEYFKELNKKLEEAYAVASEARKKGFDPEEEVNIPIARNMAERVEGLISAVAPQLVGSGVTKRIEELEKIYGSLDWRVALIISEEVAKEKFCKFKSKKEAIEVGIRTGFAYHTVGVVAAPLEGFVELDIKKTRDNKEYLAMKYAGPVRGAGGTAAAFSVLLADYVGKKMGYAPYDPTEEEVKRYALEIYDYHERVTNLQYKPSEEELYFLLEHLPVEVDGDPTEDKEVSNYKDLPRIHTNRIRGGVALVVSMLALKAPKLLKQVKRFGHDFGLDDWNFLEEFVELQKRKKAEGGSSKINKEASTKLSPDFTFIADLVGGRPVISYPLASGGFRLRYGRSRVSGFSAASIHPSTMVVLLDYIATGTQLKVERPGKAASISSCDTLEPPIVKLDDESVVKLSSEALAKKLKSKIKEVLYLGDILLSYGDFLDRGHKLVPVGYCPEWFVLELKEGFDKKSINYRDENTLKDFCMKNNISFDKLKALLKDPLKNIISCKDSILLAELLSIPIHPEYTFYWTQISKEGFLSLVDSFTKSKIIFDSDSVLVKRDEKEFLIVPVSKIVLNFNELTKRTLELLGVPHKLIQNEFIVIDEKEYATSLFYSLGLTKSLFEDKNLLKKHIENLSVLSSKLSVLDLLNSLNFTIRDKAGTFIGARMGRPEKAKMRKLTGSPHILFPVGSSGGKMRSFQSAFEKGYVLGDFPMYYCKHCQRETIYPVCEVCGEKTVRKYLCGNKETFNKDCDKPLKTFRRQKIDINHYFTSALKKLGMRTYPDLIKGVRGTANKDHIPENLAKGILRAKYKIFVNKDGTIRFDMTELPITHFKPKEIFTSIEKLKELGYTHDIYGEPLTNDEQIVELKVQDVILPGKSFVEESADSVLFRVANFIDELLTKFYGLKPFYKLKNPHDLVGKLVIGLAPHTSAGILGRIIGFSHTQTLLAHPMYHAAMRRDCDGDESCVILLMDALLNFSRQFLPDRRGSRTMDSPLVLTAILNPSEVDDMVHKMEVVSEYPLELYRAALDYKSPKDVKVATVGNFLHTEKQYEGMMFSHDTSNINDGVLCSAYKTLPTMKEKIAGQMRIAELVRAVDANDVAALVIDKHLLKDTRGNLRKFSKQQFRCVNCNKKFRRPPLIGKCDACGGRIIFTISEGSIVKYLEPSLLLSEKYKIPVYLKQSLEIVKLKIESIFGKEKEKQTGLGQWV